MVGELTRVPYLDLHVLMRHAVVISGNPPELPGHSKRGKQGNSPIWNDRTIRQHMMWLLFPTNGIWQAGPSPELQMNECGHFLKDNGKEKTNSHQLLAMVYLFFKVPVVHSSSLETKALLEDLTDLDSAGTSEAKSTSPTADDVCRVISPGCRVDSESHYKRQHQKIIIN